MFYIESSFNMWDDHNTNLTVNRGEGNRYLHLLMDQARNHWGSVILLHLVQNHCSKYDITHFVFVVNQLSSEGMDFLNDFAYAMEPHHRKLRLAVVVTDAEDEDTVRRLSKFINEFAHFILVKIFSREERALSWICESHHKPQNGHIHSNE
ncbi:MAG: hypothetical protein AAFX87_21300 [Bacteroidota bacterium]